MGSGGDGEEWVGGSGFGAEQLLTAVLVESKDFLARCDVEKTSEQTGGSEGQAV